MNQTDLLARIEKIERELNALKNVASIPRDVETAFKARLKGLYAASAATSTYTTANIRRSISLSGNAESISVLEDPAGYIPVSFLNVTRKVPFFND